MEGLGFRLLAQIKVLTLKIARFKSKRPNLSVFPKTTQR